MRKYSDEELINMLGKKMSFVNDTIAKRNAKKLTQNYPYLAKTNLEKVYVSYASTDYTSTSEIVFIINYGKYRRYKIETYISNRSLGSKEKMYKIETNIKDTKILGILGKMGDMVRNSKFDDKYTFLEYFISINKLKYQVYLSKFFCS